MVGHGLTVFQGTKPEPFKVRVISVLRNFLPKQDVILVRARSLAWIARERGGNE
jgi:hypothetical protein